MCERCAPSLSLVATAMTQIAVIEDPRGRAKIAIGIVLFLSILLFLNYGVAKALGPPCLPDVAQ